MVEHTTIVTGITRNTTNRGGWVEHEPTGNTPPPCPILRGTAGMSATSGHRSAQRPLTVALVGEPFNCAVGVGCELTVARATVGGSHGIAGQNSGPPPCH